MIAVDSSLVIAALSPWHESHEISAQYCSQDAFVPAHCLIESYSVLTRMPELMRISGKVAAEVLTLKWGLRQLVLSEESHVNMLTDLARAGVVGGSTHDGLVALTAKHHGCSIISLDHRAERTYQRLGVNATIIG